jgi:hypothetical protein
MSTQRHALPKLTVCREAVIMALSGSICAPMLLGGTAGRFAVMPMWRTVD